MVATLPGYELIQREHDKTGALIMGGAVLRRNATGTTLYPESEIYLQPASDDLGELLATWKMLEGEARFLGASEERQFKMRVSRLLEIWFAD